MTESNNRESNVYEIQSLDPNSFRVPAKDAKGHDERVWIRVQPGHAQAMEAFVQSKKFPYRSIPDLIRHAILRHLHWLNSVGPVKSVTGAVDAMLSILREDEFMSEFKQVLETLDARIYSHINQGEESQARRLVLEMLRHIKNMPAGFWRTKYLKNIEGKYGHLLKDMPKASILSFDSSEEE